MKRGDYVLREKIGQPLKKEYEKLADIYLERQLEGWGEKFNFFHFRMDLYRGPCMAKRLRGCGAGHDIWQLFQMAIFTHVINS